MQNAPPTLPGSCHSFFPLTGISFVVLGHGLWVLSSIPGCVYFLPIPSFPYPRIQGLLSSWNAGILDLHSVLPVESCLLPLDWILLPSSVLCCWRDRTTQFFISPVFCYAMGKEEIATFRFPFSLVLWVLQIGRAHV